MYDINFIDYMYLLISDIWSNLSWLLQLQDHIFSMQRNLSKETASSSGLKWQVVSHE